MSDTYHPSLLLLTRALSGRPIQVPHTSRKAATQLLKTALSHGVTAMLSCRIREGIVQGLTDEDQKALHVASRGQVA